MITNRSSKRRSGRRNGFALAMVLIGMTIATLLLVVIVQRVVVIHQRGIQRQRHNRISRHPRYLIANRSSHYGDSSGKTPHDLPLQGRIKYHLALPFTMGV